MSKRPLQADELKRRSAHLAPAFLQHSAVYAQAIAKAFADYETDGAATQPPQDALTIEALLLILHMADRAAFQLLGPTAREVFMDSLLTEMSNHLEQVGFPATALQDAYNEKQFQYSQFKKLFAAEGEPLKGTLCWEFGKTLASQYGATSPLTIMHVSMTASANAAFVTELLTTKRVGIVR